MMASPEGFFGIDTVVSVGPLHFEVEAGNLSLGLKIVAFVAHPVVAD